MRRVLSAILALALLMPAAVQAQDGAPVTDRAEQSAFLALFAGSWRAEGRARVDVEAELEDILCNMTTAYAEAAATVDNTGTCATTRGRVPLNGTLSLAADGTLTGGFFSLQRADLISSNGTFYTDRLVIESTYSVNETGRQQNVLVRIYISKPALQVDGRFAYGLIAQVQDPDTLAFEDFSNLVFERRD